MKCPSCGKVGGIEDFDYRHPVLVPNEEPYQRIWYKWFLWRCYGCDTSFVSTEEIK